jgi:dihydrofolate reductase
LYFKHYFRIIEPLQKYYEDSQNNIKQQFMRILSLYIATSLDGYIAKPGDDLNFLKIVEKEGEDYGYKEFISSIDTVIVGRKTYDWVTGKIGSAHYDEGERDVYVITRSEQPEKGRTKFYNGNLAELVRQLKGKPGKNIYCDGGAETIHELLKYDLVDEMTISIIPVLVGDGIRLFRDGRPEQLYDVVSAKKFDTGLTQLYYRRMR